jgi:hypothetical protein
LLQAYEYVRDLREDGWAFAVEIQTLIAAGMTRSDLRWLRSKGLVEHATEVTSRCDTSRMFEPACNLQFNRHTCFVLTPAGLAYAEWHTREPGLAAEPVLVCPAPPHALRARPGVPVWDRDRQELRLDEVLIKRFKAPAPNQEAILCAFEEEGWPIRIDDPIPPQRDQDPKRRLHDTINALNRNHRRPALRFVGDGSGLGVRWELLTPPGDTRPRWETNGKAPLKTPDLTTPSLVREPTPGES